MVTNSDSRDIGFVCPDGEPCLLVRGSKESNMGADKDRCSKHLNMPGLYHIGVGSETLKLGFEKVVKIKTLDGKPGFFNGIGSMIFPHGLPLEPETIPGIMAEKP